MKQEENFCRNMHIHAFIHTHMHTHYTQTMHSILLKMKYIASKFKLTTRLAKCSHKGGAQRVQNYFILELRLTYVFFFGSLQLCSAKRQTGRILKSHNSKEL